MGSLMLQEALAAAQVVAAQREATDEGLARLAGLLKEKPPAVALTVARGSSDHAANYFAYLTMSQLGVPVVSLPMSLVTLHHAPLQVGRQLAISVSQSGQSPDLVETMTALGERGAITAAFVNRTESPLAKCCQWTVPLCAGPEQSVAATKSYIGALTALTRLVAHWQGNEALLHALNALPRQLEEATQVTPSDGTRAVDNLAVSDRTMVVGRGLGFAAALEAALKLKEVSSIQAEAFSGAEIRHGPMALIDQGYPLLVFALRGPERKGLVELAEEMRGRGARVILAAAGDVKERDITLATAEHEALDPILAIQTFYLIAARVAEMRGLNPDVPRHLSKVTRTR